MDTEHVWANPNKTKLSQTNLRVTLMLTRPARETNVINASQGDMYIFLTKKKKEKKNPFSDRSQQIWA